MTNETSLRDLRGEQAAAPDTSVPKDFPAMLKKYSGEIARALPRHINPERMTRIALTAFRSSPALAECEPRSIFAAVIQSSQLGLEVGLCGEAHLVPFTKTVKRDGQFVKVKECQLIPGYQGLIKLARNSGLIEDIYGHEVREKDEFKVVLGLSRDLQHVPLMKAGFPAPDEARGEITGFYAVARFKDGSTSFVALPVSNVLKIRDRSSGYIAAKAAAKQYTKPINSPWESDFVAMGIKTAIRALCKTMPKSPELSAAVALDEIADRGARQGLEIEASLVDGTWAPPRDEDGDEPNSDGASDRPSGDNAAAAPSDAPSPDAKKPAAARRGAPPRRGEFSAE